MDEQIKTKMGEQMDEQMGLRSSTSTELQVEALLNRMTMTRLEEDEMDVLKTLEASKKEPKTMECPKACYLLNRGKIGIVSKEGAALIYAELGQDVNENLGLEEWWESAKKKSWDKHSMTSSFMQKNAWKM